MADYQERVAERITRVREQAGYDLDPFALKAGISPKQLRRIEAGDSVPRRATLRKIAFAAEVPYAEVAIDLDAEEALLQERLDDIDRKLDEILKRLPEPATTEELGDSEDALDEAEAELEKLDEDEDASGQAAGQ